MRITLQNREESDAAGQPLAVEVDTCRIEMLVARSYGTSIHLSSFCVDVLESIAEIEQKKYVEAHPSPDALDRYAAACAEFDRLATEAGFDRTIDMKKKCPDETLIETVVKVVKHLVERVKALEAEDSVETAHEPEEDGR